MKKRVTCFLAFSGLALVTFGQNDQKTSLPVLNDQPSEYISVPQYWKENNIFQHLDISLTAGTTGIGFELATPISDMFQVRAGYEFMPRTSVKMTFPLTIGGQPARQYDANGNQVETSFTKMQALMKGFSGFDVDDHVDMAGKPTMNNFKLLLDIFPFKNNKHWHFTAGFYLGPSKFAIADNTTEAMTSLLTVGIYNRMYDKAKNNDPLMDWDAMGFPDDIIQKYHLNTRPTDLYNRILGYGRLGFSVGTFVHDFIDNNGVMHKAGEAYNMEPGSDGMVHVIAKSNSFKPYLGFGYGGNMIKGNPDWQISFDAGFWFWGGTPYVFTHDGVDLTRDVDNINGKVGRYVKYFKVFKVYPCVSLRITRRIF